MEFITLLRETTADVETAAGNLTTTDVPLKRYLKETKDRIDPFETATRNPTKDPDTEVMHEKDKARDKAVSRFVLKFQSFKLSENEDEANAFEVLQILWSRHRNVQGLNFSNQTGATDNLLNDLKKEPLGSRSDRHTDHERCLPHLHGQSTRLGGRSRRDTHNQDAPRVDG